MKPNEGVGKMTNADYINIARNDSTWQDIVASFAIENIVMTEQNEIIAGKMIAGELSLPEAIRQIRENAGVSVQAGEMDIAESLH